jgi:hypothetical protein
MKKPGLQQHRVFLAKIVFRLIENVAETQLDLVT